MLPHVDAHWMLDLWHEDHLAPKVSDSFCGALEVELLFIVEDSVAPVAVGMALGKDMSKFHVRAGGERLQLAPSC